MPMHSNNNIFKNILKNIIEQNNTYLKDIIDTINKNEITENNQVHESILFHPERENLNWRVVIPRNLTRELIIVTHGRLALLKKSSWKSSQDFHMDFT